MRTELPEKLLARAEGARADAILRSCVHCGFCNATCPTYQLTGDELDGPRGRIYLIKDLLESGKTSAVTTRHLDRCLTCRACESTCPSGVQYGALLEIARERIGPSRHRSLRERVLRRLFRRFLPDRVRLQFWSDIGRGFRFLLPEKYRIVLGHSRARPKRVRAPKNPTETVVLLQGCVQAGVTPATVAALRNIIHASGRRAVVVPGETCCGSLDLHLGAASRARARARRNVKTLDRWVKQGATIISSASGCGVSYKEYGELLAGDKRWAERARALASAVVDASEYLGALALAPATAHRRVALHTPCTLQHGQQLRGLPEAALARAGYELVPVKDAHLCCGSAGTYSYLQPALADELGQQKFAALAGGEPDVIATANVGCQLHLERFGAVPVVHWLELVKAPG